MGPGLGPIAEAAAGPSRSWLPSAQEESVKQGTQAWSVQLTAAHSATLEIGSGAGSRHRLITCSEKFTGHGRGQMCVTNSKGICS